MSSNEVMQEMAAFKVAAKNAEDARARDIGMHKGTVTPQDQYYVDFSFPAKSA